MTDFSEHPHKINPAAVIEALLFVASGPVSLSQLGEVLELSSAEVEECLAQLDNAYKHERGLCLQWNAGKIQLTTSPQMAPFIEKFLGLEATSRLSRAALEALAIIAFEQPVTRPQLDAIRGVNSDGVLKNLLNKGLIQETGRAESPGRPILYATTITFLQHFGLSSIRELPKAEVTDNGRSKVTLQGNKNGNSVLKE